jgi:hypothetical protein
LGCWIAWLRDLDPMDLIWLGPVDPLTPAVDHQVPETYDDHVRVVRWADGTSPAPPAPLTRPDTAALRADAMNASAWVPLTGKALAVRLFAAADWIDAQPAPLTPTPQPNGLAKFRTWLNARWDAAEGGAEIGSDKAEGAATAYASACHKLDALVPPTSPVPGDNP